MSEQVLADLAAEQEDLDTIVAGLDERGWATPTPAEPWDVKDQIGHLAFFEEQQTLAITDPDAFVMEVNRRLELGSSAFMDEHLRRGREMAPVEVLAWWRDARASTLAAFAGVDPDARLAWFGPPMRVATAIQARLMETWAHGQDVADGLGLAREPTNRLFEIAELGVKTYSWSFLNRGMEVPAQRVRVALRGPSGTTRVWNDEASASVTGPVEEFCLVVVQRRHVLDTGLVVEGEEALRWMEIAQAYGGPPGSGRASA
ncbi:MAG TPA: TIGR03084 family metal-binding protein [Acidimicrobiia bacterium]